MCKKNEKKMLLRGIFLYRFIIYTCAEEGVKNHNNGVKSLQQTDIQSATHIFRHICHFCPYHIGASSQGGPFLGSCPACQAGSP